MEIEKLNLKALNEKELVSHNGGNPFILYIVQEVILGFIDAYREGYIRKCA